MAEVKVKIGKKADKSKVDQKKIGKGTKPEASGDVEGQYRYASWVSCPYCYANNSVTVDTNRWLGYYCWNCAGYFEV
jgi:hypothetical protein